MIPTPALTPASPPRGRSWWRAASAVPALATAAAFANAWLQWGSDYADTMAKTIQLEFVVIHAGLFLGVFILLPVTGTLFRGLRWVVVALLGYMYGTIGHSLFGWHGVIMLAGIFVATYGGLLLAPTVLVAGTSNRERSIIEIALRWGIALLAYGLLSSALSLPEQVNEWIDHRASLALGVLYFAVLGCIEYTPLYSRIRGDG